MKALVGAFNQEKALVGAFSMIVQQVVEPMDRFAALIWKYYSDRVIEAQGPQSDIPPISWSIAASGRWTVGWSHLTLNDSYSEGKKSH